MRRPSALVSIVLVLLATAGARADDEAAWVVTYPGNDPWAGWFTDAALFPDGTAFVSRSSAPYEELLRSRDFGLTWTTLWPPFARGDRGFVRMGSPTSGYAMSQRGGLATTKDSAETWQAVAIPDAGPDTDTHWDYLGTSPGGRTAVAIGRVTTWVDGCPRLPKQLTTMRTNDGGRTWRKATMPTIGLPGRVEFANDLLGLALVIGDGSQGGCHYRVGGSTATVWVTEDGGARWRKVFACPDVCRGTAWEPKTRALVVGTWFDGELFASRDLGRTFRKTATLRLGPQASFLDCVCLVSLAFGGGGWALTDGQGIWQASFADGAWRSEPSPAVAPGIFGSRGDIAALPGGRVVASATAGVLTRVPAAGASGAGPPGAYEPVRASRDAGEWVTVR